MTENIVNFPAHRIIRETTNIPLIEVMKEKSTQKFADTITEDMIGNMIEDLENSGIDIDNDLFLKDFSLAVDSLRATIYRQFDIKHHLHEFIDKNVKMINKKTGKEYSQEELDEMVDETE